VEQQAAQQEQASAAPHPVLGILIILVGLGLAAWCAVLFAQNLHEIGLMLLGNWSGYEHHLMGHATSGGVP
jgi:hypothetical protein